MITENDLRISSQSYTNKDFEAVYNELLTLAKKISYKYDPTSSNESDPFIILLKLLAFATDKLNYNVDKNILERFMPSATQESSMNDLTSRLGYNMHYYNSATTTAYFKYVGEAELNEDIRIEPLSAIIKNDTGDVQYVNTQEIIISQNTKESNDVSLMQGEINTLSVLGNDKIQLENLDENRRLYFPETQVAENGVFISGGITVQGTSLENNLWWNKVDNLNTQEYNSPCYVFRYDSKRNLPYIEFPEWIADIIGDGLSIKYLITAGINGNVSARALTTLVYTFSSSDINAEDVRVVNSTGALNGQEAETINEAYVAFKKKIGTFDTLVSCRDYANFIYNALDDNSNPLVSNIQVSDRRTDINYARNLIEYNQYGVETKSETALNSELNSSISPNELCLYPLKYVKDPSYSFSKGSANYDLTFTPVFDKNKIETELNNNLKALSHDYKEFKNGDIFGIKNYYTLNAILSTTYKVNFLEQQSIIENVKIALTNNFNARQVDFGYEIPFDRLLEVIQNADERIKSVSLEEPNQTTRGLILQGASNNNRINSVVEEPLQNASSSSYWFKVVVAQNVLSGKISLYDYNELFNYNYTQAPVTINESGQENPDAPIFYKVNNISTYANIGNISNDSADNAYVLKSNEVIQFIAPNYISGSVYPYGVNYYLKLSNYAPVQISNISNISVINNNTSLQIQYSINNERYGDVINYSSTYFNGENWLTINNSSKQDLINTANEVFSFTTGNGSTSNPKKTQFYPTNSGEGTFIKKDAEYALQPGDELIFSYTDSLNNPPKFDTFNNSKGSVIRPNFNMYTSAYRQTPREGYWKGETPTKVEGGNKYYTLSTNQEVTPLEINQEILQDEKYIYWYTNTIAVHDDVPYSSIPWKSYPVEVDNPGYEYYYYILEEGEYLFYTDTKFSYLSNYGSGTKLILKIKTSSGATIKAQFDKELEKINDITKIVEEGLQGLRSYFNYIPLNSDNTLTLQEQEIITLTEGDKIYLENSSTLMIPNNSFELINTSTAQNIHYQFEGNETDNKLPARNQAGADWWVRGLLDISAGPNLEQTLLGNQSFTISYFKGPQSETTSGEVYIENTKTGLMELVNYSSVTPSSYYLLETATINNSTTVKTSDSSITVTPTLQISNLMQEGGGENISAVYRDLQGKYAYPALYVYEKESEKGYLVNFQEHYYKLNWDILGNNSSFTLSIPNLGNTTLPYIMTYVSGVSNDHLNAVIINASDTAGNTAVIEGVNKQLASAGTKQYYLDNEMTVFKPNSADSLKDLTFTFNNASQQKNISMIISVPRYVKEGVNPLLGLKSEDNIIDFMSNNSSGFGNSEIFEKFYVTNYIDDAKAIEVSKDYPLNNSLSFYDYNNIGNKWTISQIDFANSDIRIAKSSMR